MTVIDRLYQIEIPIPVPLKTVNCYLAKSSSGWHIIDTGFHTEEAKQAWQDVFKNYGIVPQDIVEIVLTHHHPDHSGLAGWLQEYTQAPVKISTGAMDMIQFMWMERKEMVRFEQLAAQHALPVQLTDKVLSHIEESLHDVTPMPEFTLFEHGESFNWSEEFVAIETPGHAEGHMVFYSAQSKTLLAADLLLPRITPNIGYAPEFNKNPLESFINSLQHIGTYTLEHVLPGHRNRYRNGNRRVSELLNHHDERLADIIGFFTQPLTAFQVCERLFPFLHEHSAPIQYYFAFQETIAHLVYLREQGRLQSQEGDKGIVYFWSES